MKFNKQSFPGHLSTAVVAGKVSSLRLVHVYTIRLRAMKVEAILKVWQFVALTVIKLQFLFTCTAPDLHTPLLVFL